MFALPALLVLLTFSSLVTAHISRADLLKTVHDAFSAESLVRTLSNPNHRSGAADCDLDIQRLFDGLAKQELWAARVVDSSSYFITGLLLGNNAALGNYDECLRAAPPGDVNKYFPLYSLVEILVQQKKNFSTKYYKNWLTQNTDSTKWKSLSGGLKLKTDAEKTEEWSTLTSLQLGICWIRSCGAAAPGKAVASILGLAEGALQGTGFRLRVAPPSKYAEDVGLPAKLSRADWGIISLCIVIAALVLLGTLLDLAMQFHGVSSGKLGWKGVFLAFSAYTNGRRLISVGPRAPDALTAISGLKVVSIFWVMLGHRYTSLLNIPSTNKLAILDEAKNWSKQIILGGPLSVDTFFTIGGILNSYVFCMNMGKGGRLNVVKFFVHRYIRLTPPLAIMVAVTATWFYHLTSGPIWEKIGGAERANCQKYWWTSLLYIANYYNPNEQCLTPSWYLMVDMQLHWGSLLVLYPLWRWRKVGLAWLMFLIPVSCAISFAVTYAYGYRTPLPTGMVTDPGTVDTSMQNMYFPAHTRATSYLVGLLLGYYLYQIRFVITQFRLSLKTVVAGWTVSTILFLVSIFSAYPLYQFEQEVSIWASASYVSLYRLAWSLSIGWIIIACATGYGGPVNALLSWTPFVVLGRLVYGIYLTHRLVQFVDTGSARSSDYYSDFNIAQKALSDFILSACFGMILCLGIESPISALEKMLLHPPRRREAKRTSSSTPRVTSAPTGVDNPGLEAEVAPAMLGVVSEQRQQQTFL